MKGYLDKVNYHTKQMSELSERELNSISELYSQNYGVYSSFGNKPEGERIKYSVSMYKRNYVKKDFYISYSENENNDLAGFAIYIRKKYSRDRIITWVVQLVVDMKYRGRGVASQLLQSIWGFSNDFAWGLATTNPCTIKALENATFRRVSAKCISEHVEELTEVFEDIPFVELDDLESDNNKSLINSRFFVDYSSVVTPERVASLGLGDIKPGFEWFAFVFCDQPIDKDVANKNFSSFIDFSENHLIEAYSRMSLAQGWMKGTSNEIDEFLKAYDKTDGLILDIGCGRGRHSIELAKRGYRVHGIDMSKSNIEKANSASIGVSIKPLFDVVNVVTKENIDCLKDKYDAVIALFDVVGSYPDEKNNFEIVKEAYSRLCEGGVFFLSVMNMELTEGLLGKNHTGSIKENPELLFNLEPSRIMQSTGDVFDPKYMLLDETTRLIYRKEQFADDGELSAEYIIRDKRYTEKEIVDMLEMAGFTVSVVRRVRAGHFDEPLEVNDEKAKELLVIARKQSI